MGEDIAVDRVLAEFGREGAGVEPILVGNIHRTFAVHSAEGEFVLQRVNSIFSIGIHENIRAVTEHLEAKGVPTLRLVRTVADDLVADLGEHGVWRLLTRVPGVSHEICSSPELARAAGGLVARFHTALGDLDHGFQPLGIRWHDTPAYLRELEETLARHPSHHLHGEVSKLADRILETAREWSPLLGVGERVVHTDLKFNNLLFDPAADPERPEAVSLIDLDTVCRLPLFVELGDAWRSWCNRRGEDSAEAELDLDLFRASVAGYLGELRIELGREERASLVHGLERSSLELAARFAADALYESYFGWDPERFESRAEHNLVRARGQLSLAEQARATRDEQARALQVDSSVGAGRVERLS